MDWRRPEEDSTGDYRYYADRPIRRGGTVRGGAGAAPNTIGYTTAGATQRCDVETNLRCINPEETIRIFSVDVLFHIYKKLVQKRRAGMWMKRLLVSDTICMHFGYSVCVRTQIVTSSRRVIR